MIILSGYQEDAIKWMKVIEELNGGGMLADEMGLGKTHTMIGLIRQDQENTVATLILVPPVSMQQWIDSIMQQSHTQAWVISQSTKCKTPPGTVYVVATTSILNYNTKSSGLSIILATKWKRLIIDEGHIIKDGKSLANETASKIKATHKWIVTGE